MTILNLLAASTEEIIGKVTPPPWINLPGVTEGGELTGPVALLNNLLKLVFAIAGLWAFLNLILAGFSFISAGGDPKNITKAWEKIWQTFVGMLIIVCSFILAAIVGILFFKDPTAILQPKLK